MVKREFVITSAIVIVLDQIVKALVGAINWDLGIVKFHLVKNTGAGFGILQGRTEWLAIISLIVAVLMIYFYKEVSSSKFEQVFYAMFFGGVVGNLIDRVFRGFVIDFIDLGWWPVFNIADMAIVIGAIGLIIYSFKKDKKIN